MTNFDLLSQVVHYAIPSFDLYIKLQSPDLFVWSHLSNNLLSVGGERWGGGWSGKYHSCSFRCKSILLVLLQTAASYYAKRSQK